jgi:hypothetical protein
MAIRSTGFLVDVFQDSGPNERRETRLIQNSFDHRCRKASSFVLGLKNAPGGAARQAKHPSLLVEPAITGRDQCIANLLNPDGLKVPHHLEGA